MLRRNQPSMAATPELGQLRILLGCCHLSVVSRLVMMRHGAGRHFKGLARWWCGDTQARVMFARGKRVKHTVEKQ